MSIAIYRDSILDVEADCIVNPANSFLNHGGGLARIISDAATKPWEFVADNPDELSVAELRAAYDAHNDSAAQWAVDHLNAPLIATGNVHVTSAGVLPYKGVIHAVGPIWNGGAFYERALLKAAYANACAAAHDKGWRSIAFPAISCGIFGFPVKAAAPIAIDAVHFWATEQPLGMDMDVTFALFEDAHIRTFERALA
jgi:O-acetyl-ADP-ribose deacetylase (regulator of RNase III)